ncbi:hypothetical protein DSO57_1020562 [Entomophthora muscae]|uniref:Uncharacterized protein n=1 Tax=Entomophthora muscae TaxID=34485 RepID=A0ACC2T3X9_9FUNG|nr:hypothetical protein DSO57_1020562 [Entomophthora muscae]
MKPSMNFKSLAFLVTLASAASLPNPNPNHLVARDSRGYGTLIKAITIMIKTHSDEIKEFFDEAFENMGKRTTHRPPTPDIQFGNYSGFL